MKYKDDQHVTKKSAATPKGRPILTSGMTSSGPAHSGVNSSSKTKAQGSSKGGPGPTAGVYKG